jgi:hydrogenase nickel incorporation protein HypB
MCATCGCGQTEHQHSHDHPHSHQHDHAHSHEAGHAHDPVDGSRRGRVIDLEQQVLEKNDRLAAENRGWLRARGVTALNLMSSPGSGKTTLLERTVRESGLAATVVEGDQATDHDAERIRKTGARAVQINTGTGCHLDAHMVAHALEDLAPPPGSVVFIENVGNLVCPALFDLGEAARVVIASVTEGDDKPLKYPHMFRAAHLVLLNKIDLLPYVPFDAQRFGEHAREVNPRVRVLQLSALRGDGLSSWYAWLRDSLPKAIPERSSPTPSSTSSTPRTRRRSAPQPVRRRT